MCFSMVAGSIHNHRSYHCIDQSCFWMNWFHWKTRCSRVVRLLVYDMTTTTILFRFSQCLWILCILWLVNKPIIICEKKNANTVSVLDTFCVCSWICLHACTLSYHCIAFYGSNVTFSMWFSMITSSVLSSNHCSYQCIFRLTQVQIITQPTVWSLVHIPRCFRIELNTTFFISSS